jgi:ribosomal protein L11 methyltransferase
MNYAAPATMPGMTATLVTDEQSARRIAEELTDGEFADDVAVSFVDEAAGRWRVTLYFRAAVDKKAVRAAVGKAAAALAYVPILRRDWVAESLLGLPPVATGRFVVHGAHDRGCAPINRIAIEIAAAQAFGTGHHPTTRACLLALDRLNRSAKPQRVLDLGTGSGVLAIAAARSLRGRALATDIDPLAVRIARDNARLNRAGSLVCVRRASGVTLPELRARAPFDLVFANILLAPLQRLAFPLRAAVAPGGRVVLAGLLKSQANAALAAYRSFTLERRIELDGWTALVLRRPRPMAKR